MPTLEFKGKQYIYSHHHSVPFRELLVEGKKSLPVSGKKPSLDDNLIIHGDNLHALKALMPQYAGKIKCIYIDPPYNTGEEGWCYNDNVNSPLMKEWITIPNDIILDSFAGSGATAHAVLDLNKKDDGNRKFILVEMEDYADMQSGYKSRISYTDTEYFNLSEKEVRIATARRETAVPTLEQIRHVIETMPNNSDIERRNRSLIAFTLLTGARDSAIASMKLKHIDIAGNSVFQDAREVNTKFSKTFTTFFFPVGDDIQQIVCDWVRYLKKELLWGNDDPLFPKTNVINGEDRSFTVSGFKPEHWSNASPIRTIFKDAFEAADLPYFNPHSFRKTLVTLGQKLCQTPEEFKSWSQNLGHEDVLTTLYSYGHVQQHRQGEIFQKLKMPRTSAGQNVDDFVKAALKAIASQNSQIGV